MSANTIVTYVRCARQFADHFGRSPCAMGAAEIRAFLLHVVQERKLCPASFNVYAAALKFLYAVTLETADFRSGKRDSNPRHQAWEACTLPTELFPHLPA